MIARATTTVRVLRGTETDPYGDEVDSVDAGAYRQSKVPASIIERSRRVRNPVSGEIRVDVSTAGRVGAGVDLRTGDRLLDERTGQVYLVEQISQTQSPVNVGDLLLGLTSVQ